MPDYDDHIVGLAAFVGDDAAKAKEIAQAIRKGVPAVSQQLVTYGATKKGKEVEGEVATLKQQLVDATAAREEAEQALADHLAKTPDVAAIEAKANDKWAKKLKEKDDALTAKDSTLKSALVDVRTEQATARAIAFHRVDPEYAREVLKPKLGRRMKPNDDGKVTIMQFGADDPYDADSDDKAIDLLLVDAVKSVPAKFVLSNADRGAGSDNRGGGGGTMTVDRIAENKAKSGDYGL